MPINRNDLETHHATTRRRVCFRRKFISNGTYTMMCQELQNNERNITKMQENEFFFAFVDDEYIGEWLWPWVNERTRANRVNKRINYGLNDPVVTTYVIAPKVVQGRAQIRTLFLIFCPSRNNHYFLIIVEKYDSVFMCLDWCPHTPSETHTLM